LVILWNHAPKKCKLSDASTHKAAALSSSILQGSTIRTFLTWIFFNSLPIGSNERTWSSVPEAKFAKFINGVSSYEEGRMLSGLLFLHRISDNRMSASPIRLLETFKSICGQQAFQNVILVTTMWDEVPLDVGQERENQLRDGHWKSMLTLGSTTARFLNTKESAWDTISQFRFENRRATLLQEELVERQMSLPETTAGRSMLGWLGEIIESLKEALRRLRKRLRKARKTYKGELRKDINQQEQTLQAADRLLGKYSLPSKGPTRSASSPPFVIVRPSTPYSDLPAVSSPSSTCVALPNSSADSLNLRCTNRQILHASITSLKTIHQLAGVAPVPGLQGVVGVILRIGEMIEV
jgi:hypothetical protein